ncbi:MAG: sigma-70 family RNA polymerase sigma factor, partial [bacterium]|nr:sigma-70 family RNA polymerase sigma factor [bacterium]
GASDGDGGTSFLFEEIPDAAPRPDAIFDTRVLNRDISLAIEKLPAAYRDTLTLYYQDDRNFREIAELRNDPVNTIKSRHRRALQALKKFLSGL